MSAELGLGLALGYVLCPGPQTHVGGDLAVLLLESLGCHSVSSCARFAARAVASASSRKARRKSSEVAADCGRARALAAISRKASARPSSTSRCSRGDIASA